MAPKIHGLFPSLSLGRPHDSPMALHTQGQLKHRMEIQVLYQPILQINIDFCAEKNEATAGIQLSGVMGGTLPLSKNIPIFCSLTTIFNCRTLLVS